MKIGFIGAGKAGFSLGKFFSEGGIWVTGFYSRHRKSAEEAALFCSAEVYDTLEEVVQSSDAIFLTVPDGMISSVYEQLRRLDISGKQLCHCSGVMTAREAFPGIEAAGAYGYSIHPLFPINSKYNAYRELADAFFCLEGDGPHLAVWKKLLEKLGAKVQLLDGEKKQQYHAACSIASNLMCALVSESVSLLEDCGFTKEGALCALEPLMKSNLEHMIREGPVAALTGPLERGDVSTLEKHISCIQKEPDRQIYIALSLKLLALAKEKNPQRDYGHIGSLLKKEMEPYEKHS